MRNISQPYRRTPPEGAPAASRPSTRLVRATRPEPPALRAKEREPRETRIGLRLQPEDADAWRAAALTCGMNLSDWLRLAVRAGAGAVTPTSGRRTPDRHKPDLSKRRYTAVDPALLFQLSQAGNSLNQCAQRLNSQHVIGQAIDLLNAAQSLKRIDESLKAIRAEHLGKK